MCLLRQRLLGSARGQAIFEYVIILFVTMTLVLGVIYQFNDSVRVYFDDYFGRYLGCLIENGILPGVSSDTCPAPQWNPTVGKSLKSPAVAANSSGSNGGKNVNNANRNGSGGGRAAETNPGVVPLNSADRSIHRAGDTTGITSKMANTGDMSYLNAGNGDFLNQGNNEFSSGYNGEYMPYEDGGTGSKLKKGNQDIPTTARDLKTARELAAEKLKKSKSGDEGVASLTIGNLFKYFIIFLLLFAIVFFVGSQLMAISRGGRKRG